MMPSKRAKLTRALEGPQATSKEGGAERARQAGFLNMFEK